uniref:NADH dehydrogenase [ubiquinone] iron-sulfur protein 3 n=1 Tax=Entransia fimbriata TaxID=130991 RepID=U5YE79_9VIRI|nr:NADH dehydrogenase subunit 9 [Entransia fimbriata]AGZ90298.1 NADH dehydrogenase subunit 9 [Entransia fimbriata]
MGPLRVRGRGDPDASQPRMRFPGIASSMLHNLCNRQGDSEFFIFRMSNFILSLVSLVPKWLISSKISLKELEFYVKPENIHPLLKFLKLHTNTQYKILIDICGIDYPSNVSKRFTIVYNLLSVKYNTRIRIKTKVDEITSIVSVSDLFPSANWPEREVWDMFGVYFLNHPDLRRILTDYGFEGHPLRKDFPLSGYVEVRYDDSEKRVISEPIEMTQEFRCFDFTSPWSQF